MEQESLEKMIYDETEKRLKIMEGSEYVFPKRIGKMDVAGILVAIGLSMLLIILCMLGVIV